MNVTVYQQLGLRPVINAAGKMTYLGGSVCSPAVTAAMATAAADWVDMAELMAAADRLIAAATGAEAGHVTSCTAAGLAVATAACLTRGDAGLTEQLPDLPAGMPRRIIIQKGHAIHFGAPLVQMLRLAGADVAEVGTVNQCGAHNLAAALAAPAAGVVFVVSHHTAPQGMLDLEVVVEQAHAAGLPVVVDAAAEMDLRKYIAAGADLVIYSGHKALGAPTSGLICGRRDLVAACARQNQGIGRAMKIGKEGIVGLMAALQQFLATDPAAEESLQEARAAELLAGLQALPGLAVTLARDNGRPITRVRVAVTAGAGITAADLVARLQAMNPSVRTRAHHAAAGWFEFDPRPLRAGDPAAIVRAVAGALTGATP